MPTEYEATDPYASLYAFKPEQAPEAAAPAGTTANDGNAGEWDAKQYMTASASSIGLSQDHPLAAIVAGFTGGMRGLPVNPDGSVTPTQAGAPAPEQSVFDRISGKLSTIGDRIGTGVSKAFDKDPNKFLEIGLGAIASAYDSQQKRAAAEKVAQGRIDEINTRAGVDKATQDRYNASFSTAPRTAVGAAKPLARTDGTRIYANGKLKG
jgi:hypothetical protein